MRQKTFVFILVLCMMTTTVIGLTEEERVYFDNQNQKVVAQLSSKIDTQATRFEKTINEQVSSQSQQIKEQISREIKSTLIGLSVGIAGFMIIVLSVFRILDNHINPMKKVKRYESQLQGQIKENEEEKKRLKEFRKELEDLKLRMLKGLPEPPKPGLFSKFKRSRT